MNSTIISREPVRFAGPQLDRKFDRLFRQFFQLQELHEQATVSGPNASSNLTPTPAHTLTLRPTILEPETDKTNSPATDTAPPTLGAGQIDKTNSPTTGGATNPLAPAARAARQFDKTNSPAVHATDAPRPTSEAALQTDKTNSPGSHRAGAPYFRGSTNRQNELTSHACGHQPSLCPFRRGLPDRQNELTNHVYHQPTGSRFQGRRANRQNELTAPGTPGPQRLPLPTPRKSTKRTHQTTEAALVANPRSQVPALRGRRPSVNPESFREWLDSGPRSP